MISFSAITSARGIKSFLLSLILHLGVCCLFTITFANHPVISQPTFYFLGSLLGQQDVLSPIFREDATAYQTPIPLVSRRISRSKVNPEKLTAVSKPQEGRGLADSQKEYQKSFFAVSLTPQEEKSITPGIKENDLKVPRLNPAKLYRP